MNKLPLLLKREYWEHRGGFLWTPIWVTGVTLAITVLGLVTAEIFRSRSGVNVGFSLDMMRQHLEAKDYVDAGYGLDVVQFVFGALPCVGLFFVLFFYLLGGLYDDRRDRSVLFWKSLPVSDATTVLSKAASWNSLPILRYAEVLLNYAEAKAELGEMDAAVWDQTIAQLRSRAGVTPVVPDKADPYMEAYFLNTVTDKWILEVRRERGIELCLEMGLRWDDDMRWHMGDLLTSDNNPWTGIWIGNTGYTYDFTGQSTDDNGDPVPDFYIRPGEDTEHSIAISNTGANQTFSLNAAGNIVWEYKRTWGEKKYLRPIPQTAITRNPNLEQNALWK